MRATVMYAAGDVRAENLPDATLAVRAIDRFALLSIITSKPAKGR